MLYIVYADKGDGWSPITHMVHLAARLFNAELLVIDYKSPSLLAKLKASVFNNKLKRNQGNQLLIVCPSAEHLNLLLQLKNYKKEFNVILAWVIDSFWVDWVPKWVGISNFYDHIFITTEEDIGAWSNRVRCPVTWLPWGSDVLGLGGGALRGIDLLRVGRQPMEWDDDELTALACKDADIGFHGRPVIPGSASQNQKGLMRLYKQAKFLLAFSNLANPANYTHPHRAYLTGRWVDALACGGIVVGIAPREESIDRLLWDGATLELESTKMSDGLDKIRAELRLWTPEKASYNYLQSLKRLDWRWRFNEIAKTLNISPNDLVLEIEMLESQISQMAVTP